MRRLPAVALVLFLAGCSNAPVAGFLDCVAPAKGGPPDTAPAPAVPGTRPPQPPTDVLPPPADLGPPVTPRP